MINFSSVKKIPAKIGFSDKFHGCGATTATLFVLLCLGARRGCPGTNPLEKGVAK
jgi:hypothetical protein